ncbi:nitroreductase family protein [soil metagenome]
MTLLSAAVRLDVIRDASRAPSVHNIQPARWRFLDDDSVVLFRALDRVLPVADPSGHDVAVSLGAAFEGLALALSARGIALSAPEFDADEHADGCVPVARAAMLVTDAPVDVLSRWLTRRRSFRGRFLPVSADDLTRIALLLADDARLIASAELTALAARHDVATWSFESQPAYHAELWNWLRLSRDDSRYERDGLNAECLALSGLEAWFANQLLRPSRFALLSKLGIARHLVSEAPQVRSAAVALVFCPLRALSSFDVGRRMHRLWLEVTAAGLHLAPMSALADDPASRSALEAQCGVGADRRVANVLRVGRAPEGAVAESGRLPVEELLV